MEEQEITIDLCELWQVLKDNKGLIGKVTAGCIVAAGLYLAVAPPVYESTALLRVHPPIGINQSLLDALPGNATKQMISTYEEVIKSRSVVLPVIKATEEPDRNGNYISPEDYAKNKIVLRRAKDTEIMAISVKANNPEQAQKANRMLLSGFLHKLNSMVRSEKNMARSFVEGRLTKSLDDLKNAENELTEFKKTHKLLASNQQVKNAMENMKMASKERMEAVLDLEEAKAQNAAVNAQLEGQAATIANNDAIRGYQIKLADLEATRISYLEKYTENHPKVIEINSNIENMKAQLQEEIAKVAKLEAPSENRVHQEILAQKFASEVAINVAENKLAAIQDIEDKYARDIEYLSKTEAEYVRLERNIKVAEGIYTMLVKRLEEAKVAEEASSTEIQMVDEPNLPEKPVSPKKMMTLALATMIGLLSSCGYVIAKHLIRK